jgi:hypothetical protein
VRQSSDDGDHAGANIRIEVDEQLLLLIHEIVGDPRAQIPSGTGSVQRNSAPIRGVRMLLGVPLLHERANDAARRAFVQEEALGQVTEAQWAMVDEGLERVALRDRDVVAADAIPIAELVHANEVGDGRLQSFSVSLQLRDGGRAPGQCGRHIVGSDNYIGGPQRCQVPATLFLT